MANKFKKDPLYNSFIKYLEDEAKEFINEDNKIESLQTIEFYEKYVDNFCDFKDIFFMRMQVKELVEQIDLNNRALDKLELVKDPLNPNQENYLK